MRRTSFLAALVAAFVTMPALAQATPASMTMHIRGTVEKLDGRALTVSERDGDTASVTLAPGATVDTLVKRSLADIKPGDFVASTGIKGEDGQIHAIEVRIFPKADPNGGRQFAWDLAPNSVMTNATVGRVTKAPQGEELHVTFKGGKSEYSVGPGVPILAPAPGNISLLKPGAAVLVIAVKHSDGRLTSTRLYAEKNGVKPPM